MEIKVGIRVKVLVSPLPPRGLLLPGETPVLSSLLLPRLPGAGGRPSSAAVSASLRLPLWFDIAAGDTTARQPSPDRHPFLLFFPPHSRRPSLLFSRPGNKPSAGASVSLACLECYFCNILTNNRFSLSTADYRGSRSPTAEKPRYVYVLYVRFSSSLSHPPSRRG